MPEPIRVLYFSDVLCVWAYVAQRRLDELIDQFDEQIRVSYHFVPVLASTPALIGERLASQGGYEAFAKHIIDVVGGFDHVEVSDRVWRDVRPASSASAHLFLHAVDLASPTQDAGGRSAYERAAWRVRQAFFQEARDVSSRPVLLQLADELDLPVDAIRGAMDDGRAMARLFGDLDLRDEHKVRGSPTYVLNEGRQVLYGNVGYRIIEANVQEILTRPEAQASWC